MSHSPHTSSEEPVIAEGEDEQLVKERLKRLIEIGIPSSADGLWSLSTDRMGIERHISFRTFKLCWEFMNLVAKQCQKEKHHPEWTNVYRNVTVRWTTHVPRGLSLKDIRMAEYCDYAECAVQNSPAELKRLHTRGELTEEEYGVLLGLWSGKTGAADMAEIVPTLGVGTEEASTGNSEERSREQKEFGRREAFRKRLERMKRHFALTGKSQESI